jgi:SPP1 family predicted phage head-tail adaptor
MNIGDLNRRIAFITHEEVENAMGLTELKEKELLTCWAKIKTVRGREYYEAQKIRTENTYEITIRYCKAVDDTMLIRYKNQTIEIQNIVDPGMANRFLEIYCTEKTRGEGTAT